MMRRFLYAIGLFLAGCSSAEPERILEPPKPGIVASPRWLTFRCVEPGCDETLTAAVKVVGDRDVAIKRIVLSDDERTDFVLSSTEDPPFVLKAKEQFAVDVRFRPDGDPRLGDIDLLVTYTDASASETDDRIQAGELHVPLVRRLVGEPTMLVSPMELSFGAVSTTTTATKALAVKNDGSGNIGLVIDEVTSSEPEITVTGLPPNALLPGSSHNLIVNYAPIDERYTDAELSVKSADPLAPPVIVKVRGTSIPHPSVVARPEDGVDFGEVPVGTMASVPVELVNRGAGNLEISALELVDNLGGALTLTLPRVRTTTVPSRGVASLAPLETYALTVDLTAATRGEINTQLRVTSNDRQNRTFDIPVKGLITEPAIVVNPANSDFGTVPRGWVQTRPVEIQNSGYGELLVSNVSFVLGSSELFNFKTVPNLPVRLSHGERFGFEVEFRSETEARFTATLSVESNDPNNPYVEVTLSAQGASCDAGCPILNGTPSCASGVCSIGMCNPGYFDADGQASSGCECQDVGRDPGAFCNDSESMGTLSDEGSRAQFTGLVPTAEDIDLVRFFAYDESQFLDDDYDVEITLQSSDPGIKMCVYKHETGTHDNNCFFDGENCGGRSYHDGGSFGSDDSADFVIKVFRDPNVPGTCTTYTVFMKNG